MTSPRSASTGPAIILITEAPHASLTNTPHHTHDRKGQTITMALTQATQKFLAFAVIKPLGINRNVGTNNMLAQEKLNYDQNKRPVPVLS